ncbi:hypothetical protein Tsubulata_035536 [Turnera subulata]|uniref:DUF4283 domain-containing protein n=1 Tax=Turnera subulata TaxID=218843 RepID=A0A9Q0J100_9ROSI|nr:hypothetical protein Tsubulata_035536 [Turnera subulata]
MAAAAGSTATEADELSVEEVDQQEKSNKKAERMEVVAEEIVDVEEDDRLFSEETRRKVSYKSMLSGLTWDNVIDDTIMNNLEDGKQVGYRFLHRTLMNQWKPRGEIVMADMGNEFYLLQFNTKYDYNRVLYDGSWMVANHVLTVRGGNHVLTRMKP